MPVYEYFCEHCDGVFETIRTMSKASEPAPCPLCSRKAGRIPPTSFSAFTMRQGYPRAIPDRGTYYHLGKEVKNPIRGKARMNEHPELAKPRPPKRKSKADLEIEREKRQLAAKEEKRRIEEGRPKTYDSPGFKRLKG
jgi:putative FmdB family regulatory protein